ncbi:hypothetical protein PGT21_006478 [Puccinia graminis f. sp. tritici]|uniref:Uncharacterized protein n=1 Tax=Puccinia graminis f. sp. tritici TaxID=56615 RepID=A0A5B0N4K2_PUCGR|nr:hypothetical protein PGTUg99_035206 [Puccinia graminis f. sp. tritici]KAA1094016.1 hypothetical protein PGT21_006478 [Puccinia graminis f. sp. tritici]
MPIDLPEEFQELFEVTANITRRLSHVIEQFRAPTVPRNDPGNIPGGDPTRDRPLTSAGHLPAAIPISTHTQHRAPHNDGRHQSKIFTKHPHESDLSPPVAQNVIDYPMAGFLGARIPLGRDNGSKHRL